MRARFEARAAAVGPCLAGWRPSGGLRWSVQSNRPSVLCQGPQHPSANRPAVPTRGATPLCPVHAPVPPHRAFYEAGNAWRAAGRLSMAFVLLNRYLDIEDALGEGGGRGPLEAADFVGTDVPGDAPLPAQHYCGERQREEVGKRAARPCFSFARTRSAAAAPAAHALAGAAPGLRAHVGLPALKTPPPSRRCATMF